MKKFLIRLTLFALMVSVIVLLLLHFAGGYVDYFYVKFTSKPQKSLILGDSRSFQGMRPSEINAVTASQFEGPVYNYAFTMAQAAYGDLYLESVKRKLDPTTKNGLFILTVQPSLLAQRPGEDPESGKYFEENVPPHNVLYPNMNPNLEYLFRNISYFHFKAILKRETRTHKDGWLEEGNIPSDPAEKENIKKRWIERFKGFGTTWKSSEYRLKKLKETITFLQEHGTVFLVRMPVSQEFLAVEHDFWQDFDSRMSALSNETGSLYLNYAASQDFETFDGVHLDKSNCIKFSRRLGLDISKSARK